MATFAADLRLPESNLRNCLRSPDDRAFHKLFLHFRRRVYGTALRILKEEEAAKDALQETMIKVYRAAHSFRGDSSLATWINRIAVNVCLEMLRRNRKHSAVLGEDVTEKTDIADRSTHDPYQQTYQREIAAVVHSAFARLSKRHRFVVQKHDLEGFTIPEITAMLDIAEGTVKSRLFYGREELKRHLSALLHQQDDSSSSTAGESADIFRKHLLQFHPDSRPSDDD